MEAQPHFWAGGKAEADKAKRQFQLNTGESWYARILSWYAGAVEWMKGDYRLFGKKQK